MSESPRTLMTGNNTLVLNAATIMAILQQWIDAEFSPRKSQRVASIRMSTQGNTLEVLLADPEDDDK